MVISHNMMAMNARIQFNMSTDRMKKVTERLSSGYKINRAADDAAGLSISENMRRQIRGLNQGARNLQDGISVLQVADGALNEIHSMLHRINELSVQSANGTNSKSDRESIQEEVNQIISEVDRIAETTMFNDKDIFGRDYAIYNRMQQSLLNGTYRLVSEDIKLKDGQIIAKDAANAMIGLLSNVSIIGKTYDIYKEVKEQYSSRAIGKYGIPEVSEYLMANRRIIKNNMHPIYSFSNNSDYKTAMGDAEELLELALTAYEQSDMTAFDNYMDAVHNKYSSETHASGPVESAMVFGVIDTDYIYYIPFDTSHETYLGSIVYAGSEYYRGMRDFMDQVGIGGDLYNYVSDAHNKVWGVSPGELINPDADLQELTTKTYMKILGMDDELDRVEGRKPRHIWIQSSSTMEDGFYIDIENMNSSTLGVSGIDVSSESGAMLALGAVGTAIEKVSSLRSQLGAQQNRIEHTYNSVTNTAENVQAAESRIRDADLAKEMVEFSKHKMLEQVGESMISQANQSQQGILSLLQ